ncbi:hypothetical protein C468_00355 [Halorubrum kocurii JCM 14978]|uniref:DUF4129 domain-containing protein n=2 Tax=Halorubrum kocurii TaxID=478441 RepID=M0PK73_9EURY|nr:hypothetical protein C468_00355 [Halorubrum kocurii JCM 14978]
MTGSAGAVGPSTSAQDIEVTNTVAGGNLTGENTTTPHEDPETVAEDGDTEQIASHLSGRLGTLLGGSTRNISAAEYDQARSLVGDEYDEVLSQYVTVAGETEQEDTAETFATVQNDTAELTALREEFETTRTEYEEAVAEGDTQRARQLARELARLSTEINVVTERLDKNLKSIENATGTDLESVRRNIESVRLTTAEISRTALQVELTATTITATAAPSTFSFQNATQLTGTLRTTNGTPISNKPVTIQVGERSYNIKTDAEGSYTLTYRPVFLPVNATSVPVEFRPTDTSPYLAANTTTPAQITAQTTTTVTVANDSITGNYQTPLRVSSIVTVGTNATVSGLPVRLLLDGQQIGTGETQPDGQVTLTGTVPADVAGGAANLQLQVPLSETAVTGSNTTTTAEITPVETQLTVNATVTGTDTEDISREAVLTGDFTLADGSPVPGQSLDVFVGDRQIGTVTSTADGSYQTTVAATEFDEGSDAPTIRTAFTGSETHLAASEATTTLDLPTASQRDTEGSTEDTSETSLLGSSSISQIVQTAGSEVSLQELAGIGGGLLLVGIILILVARRFGWDPRDRLTPPSSASSTAATDDTPPTTDPSGEPSAQTTRSQQLLDEAATALAAENTTVAVQLAYGSLRAALQTQVDTSEPTTHWEFYDRCQDADIESLAETKAVITAYEMATFAQPTVSTERAREVLEQVAAVIDQGGSTPADSQLLSDD